VLTIEPGYYDVKAGFGIRIENVYIVRAAYPRHTHAETGTKFLCFEYATLVPIQTTLIELSLLTFEEVNWLNMYHARVEQHIGKALVDQNKPAALIKWLKAQCAPLDVSKAHRH